MAKRDLVAVRRAVWPLREALSQLLHDPAEFVTAETRLHLRDCYDHAIQIMDFVESCRELAGGLVDVYMSHMGNRMNDVMRVLTIIATIFIPLSFVAGVYGMNFDHMPELSSEWGYPAVLIVIAITCLVLHRRFKRAGWL
jgi:magnesium transporter